METTFITIHDLGPDARILYSSESVVDVLGYRPDEIVNKSCWTFFHPDELELARAQYERTVTMDKAAVLSYCRMLSSTGVWVGCELVFTIVYDVLVGCTTIYHAGARSQNRAEEAPQVRRLFSYSPRDPRYHMLSHLSTKFSAPAKAALHEPRAALFLNRYTRTLTIMYATDGLSNLLGVTGEQLCGLSFYYCIAESCLSDAVRCLEGAKQNDSIAYLRFEFRDPRPDHVQTHEGAPHRQDLHSTRSAGTDDSSFTIDAQGDTDMSTDNTPEPSALSPNRPANPRSRLLQPLHDDSSGSRTSSDESNNTNSHEAIFGHSRPSEESSSSSPMSDSSADRMDVNSSRRTVELEAVISCTSDGLVVCLRKARPPPPIPVRPSEGARSTSFQGAVPWGASPILLPGMQSPEAQSSPEAPTDSHSRHQNEGFMASIQDCAVFAWGLTGINGTLASYGAGQPRGESQPPAGVAIWDPSDSDQQQQVAAVQSPPANQLLAENFLGDAANLSQDHSACRGPAASERATGQQSVHYHPPRPR